MKKTKDLGGEKIEVTYVDGFPRREVLAKAEYLDGVQKYRNVKRDASERESRSEGAGLR